jgi:hypothetical protein
VTTGADEGNFGKLATGCSRGDASENRSGVVGRVRAALIVRIMYPPEGIGNGATSKIDRFLRVFSSNHTETRADFHSLWTFDRCQCFVKKSKIALA